MEDILGVYALPYDPLYPVICFDERPCFLIGDTVAPIPTQEGKIAKHHYAYEKNGSCCLLAAIEPLQGKRLAKVYSQRTKKEYTFFMQNLAKMYPEAIKIRLVQDNLNTHNFFTSNIDSVSPSLSANKVIPLRGKSIFAIRKKRFRSLKLECPFLRRLTKKKGILMPS